MSEIDLEKIYLETTYSVFVDEDKYDIKIGKVLPSALQQLVNKGKSAAILTAWNPKSQALPSSDNHLRNNQLAINLEKYIVYKAMGQGVDLTWQPEKSFFIVGIEQCEVDKLAVDFEQFAYVYCEYDKLVNLVFTKLWIPANDMRE